MNKKLFSGALAIGAMTIVSVAIGFIGSNYLALVMTAIIGLVYGFGVHELRQFRRTTASLHTALGSIPENLAVLSQWLDRVPESLQNSVRLRIEGERTGLPGPSLTPYLVGLLVMLGMLGTFIGMVVTFNGAVFALEGSTDLQAIRSALAAPIRGLGLAFGTSVAGVAASAMLGLMSALSRRDRLQVAQLLDNRIATDLHRFSFTHQRQETFKAIQSQAQALPAVVDQLQSMMSQMERMSHQLNQQLLSNQESFHAEVKNVYGELANSVDASLKNSLSQGAMLAGESIKPVLEATMNNIAHNAVVMQQQVVSTTQQQIDHFAARFDATVTTVSDTWKSALAQHTTTNDHLIDRVGHSFTGIAETIEQRASELIYTLSDRHASLQAAQAASDQQRMNAWQHSLESMAASLHREFHDSGVQTLTQQNQICTTLTETARSITEHAQAAAVANLNNINHLVTSSEELVRSRMVSEANWLKQHGERMDQLVSLLHTELGALRDQEAARGHAAVERLGELQAALTSHLTTLGTALEEPITRLIHTASEAPRAAAEVIGQLRQEISHSLARDNELLEERSRIMATLSTLLDAINHAASEQRAVIDALVESSAVTLHQAGAKFADQVESEAIKLADIGAQVSSSAIEVSSLGEAFGLAVRSFDEANAHLIANLQRIEAALDKSTLRSDEQLAYYVAQAREVIDLSILSQKQIVDELRQLPGKSARVAAEAC